MSEILLKVVLAASTAAVGMPDGRIVVRRNFGCGYGCQTVYAPPAVVVQQPVAAWQYSVGAERFTIERIKKLEQIVEGQQILNEQLAKIVSGNQAGNVSQSEVAVRAVFTRNCLKCHSGQGAKAGMDLTIPEFSVFDKALVSQMVGSGQMPPPDSGVKLSKADLDVIQEWAGESAEEFRQTLRELRQSAPKSNGRRSAPAPAPMPPRPMDNGTR